MSLQLSSYLICGRWNIVSRKTHSVNFIAPIFGHYLSTPAKSGVAVPRHMRTVWNIVSLHQLELLLAFLTLHYLTRSTQKQVGNHWLRDAKNRKLSLMYKIVNNEAPLYLSDLFPRRVEAASNYNLRNSRNFDIPFTRVCSFETTFFPSTIRLE